MRDPVFFLSSLQGRLRLVRLLHSGQCRDSRHRSLFSRILPNSVLSKVYYESARFLRTLLLRRPGFLGSLLRTPDRPG